MSEDNPYTLIRETTELCWELDRDLSDEYWDITMVGCREDIFKINQKIKRIEKWIRKKEEFNEREKKE